MWHQNAEGWRTFAELRLSVNQVDETKSMLICENRKHTEIAKKIKYVQQARSTAGSSEPAIEPL